MAHPGLAAKAHFAGGQGLLTAAKVRDPANTWDLLIIIILVETFWLVSMYICIYYMCIYACIYIYKRWSGFFLKYPYPRLPGPDLIMTVPLAPTRLQGPWPQAPICLVLAPYTASTGLCLSWASRDGHLTLGKGGYMEASTNGATPKRMVNYWKILLNWIISEYPPCQETFISAYAHSWPLAW